MASLETASLFKWARLTPLTGVELGHRFDQALEGLATPRNPYYPELRGYKAEDVLVPARLESNLPLLAHLLRLAEYDLDKRGQL